MGLNEQFTAVRSHLLLMKPTPTLSAAYSVLLQEENQRDCNRSLLHESVAMAVRAQHTSNFANKSAKSAIKKSEDFALFCDYFQLTGHTRDKCFCLHGYPDWHRLYGKPKPQPRIHKGNSKPKQSAHAYNVSTKSTGISSNTHNL